MLQVALLIMGGGCLMALFNWRWGVAAAILVGLVQDPLRKMIPETPGFLAMASVPVWLCVLGAAGFRGELRLRAFLDQFPRLGRTIILFAVYLVVPALVSATYGPGSWKITLLGGMIYSMALLVLLVGWQIAKEDTSRLRVLGFYAVLASAMLIGGPLEFNGWSDRFSFLGTQALGHVWVTHRTGSAVYMIAGLFRGPDVMGWHATLVFMISLIMALRTKGVTRYIWIGLAVWGVLNIWLCGRRKMLAMIPVFLGCYLFLIFKYKDARRFIPALSLLLMTMGLGWYIISSLFFKSEVQEFYLTTITEADSQVKKHGIDSVFVTFQQAGFLGYGLGMGQQGTHHLAVSKPRMWQESGPTKLMAELGVPGSILFVWVIGTLIITVIHVIRFTAGDSSFHLSAGLLSILVANMTSALVSAQIYGDPFVALMLSLITGMLLAAVRFSSLNQPAT